MTQPDDRIARLEERLARAEERIAQLEREALRHQPIGTPPAPPPVFIPGLAPGQLPPPGYPVVWCGTTAKDKEAPQHALGWCQACGEGVTTFCRGKGGECAMGLISFTGLGPSGKAAA